MRKHRRYGHRRSRWSIVLVVLLVVAAAAGAYALQRRNDDSGGITGAGSCPSIAPSVVPSRPVPAKTTAIRLPAPGQVALRLLNGAGRDKLARAVGDELARRGFRVTHTGNAPRALVGASRVYYGPTGRPAALLVSAQVLGSSVVPVPSAPRGAIDVVLGSAFVRLRTAAETSVYARQVAAGSPPAAPAAPTPAASPSCR
jgi:hypothetical protein